MHDSGAKDRFERLAERYMKEGRHAEAIDLYKKLVDQHPGEDSYVFQLALAFKDAGKLDDAVECLEGLLEKELKRKVFTGFAYDELVRIFRQEGQHERLVGVCESAVEAQPEDPALLFTLGDAYIRAGRPGDAVEIFLKLTAMDPESSLYFSHLGLACISAGDFDRARAAYEKSIAIEPECASLVHHKRGVALSHYGHHEMAVSAFRDAIQEKPEEALYFCDLGDALVRLGQIEEAGHAYDEAVRKGPSSAAAYLNRFGKSLLREKKTGEAVEAFKKAVEKEPANPFYTLHLAEAYVEAGLPEMAEDILKKLTTRGACT
ncbi:MAG TPA: tetratricopeptide repeat protein [Syntrophales bacterium]|nr:tetratricopeptide repeat protein [Syntrophales bacterium]HQM28735.1 tetratricopeptide repeat protein [Syntrophales bacterium]